MSQLKFVLLTFATEDFEPQRRVLVNHALANGFARSIECGPQDFLRSEFANRHAAIVGQARGAGYWLWKPYFLREALTGLAPDEVLVYSDAGRDCSYRVDPPPKALAKRALQNGFGFIIGPTLPQHGPLERWTKRDCLILVGNDDPDLLGRPVIQATWSVWTKCSSAAAFLDEWLNAACDPRALTDLENELGKPNAESFVDHRHDQSILTILAYKRQVDILDYSKTGLYKAFAVRPSSRIAHSFMKSLRNAERLEATGRWRSPLLLEAFRDLLKKVELLPVRWTRG